MKRAEEKQFKYKSWVSWSGDQVVYCQREVGSNVPAEGERFGRHRMRQNFLGKERNKSTLNSIVLKFLSSCLGRFEIRYNNIQLRHSAILHR